MKDGQLPSEPLGSHPRYEEIEHHRGCDSEHLAQLLSGDHSRHRRNDRKARIRVDALPHARRRSSRARRD
jgi:hypothetical protein